MKFLEDEIRENLGDFVFGNDILVLVSKAWFMKEKIVKFGLYER